MAIIHNNMAVFFPSRPASIPEAWPLPLSIIATHALLLVGQALLDLQTASTLSTHRVAPIYHCPSLFRQLSAIMKQVQHSRVSIANLATLVIVSVLSINTSAVPICEQTKVFHVEAKAMRTLSFKNREANRLLLIEGTAIVLSTHLAGQRSRLILIEVNSIAHLEISTMKHNEVMTVDSNATSALHLRADTPNDELHFIDDTAVLRPHTYDLSVRTRILFSSTIYTPANHSTHSLKGATTPQPPVCWPPCQRFCPLRL